MSDLITFDMIFGHTDFDTRLVEVSPGRWVGEARTKRYDGDGRLIEDTGWKPTGVEAWLE